MIHKGGSFTCQGFLQTPTKSISMLVYGISFFTVYIFNGKTLCNVAAARPMPHSNNSILKICRLRLVLIGTTVTYVATPMCKAVGETGWVTWLFVVG